jgi:transposase
MAEVEIQTERVDDIPLLVHQQQKMGIPEVLDSVICPHGNWQAMSIGWLATGWIRYILSEADHRMSEVEPWAAERMETQSILLPGLSGEHDFTDDRLGDALGHLGCGGP